MGFLFGRKNKQNDYIDRGDVLDILSDFCTDTNQLADRRWKLIPDKTFFDICDLSNVKRRLYIAEVYDCDNIAHELLNSFNGMGFMVGIIQGYSEPGKKHRWIFYINSNKKLVHIEPATYKVIHPPKICTSDFVYTI